MGETDKEQNNDK